MTRGSLQIFSGNADCGGMARLARLFTIAILFATLLAAGQEYAGPPPPRKDTPYLVQADNLIETEVSTARKHTARQEVTYIIPGDRSKARTPVASPILIVETENPPSVSGWDAEALRLFRLQVKNGHREIGFDYKGKSGTVPLRADIMRISTNLYRIEVVDGLVPGEYALSPDGSNQVFCFEVF